MYDFFIEGVCPASYNSFETVRSEHMADMKPLLSPVSWRDTDYLEDEKYALPDPKGPAYVYLSPYSPTLRCGGYVRFGLWSNGSKSLAPRAYYHRTGLTFWSETDNTERFYCVPSGEASTIRVQATWDWKGAKELFVWGLHDASASWARIGGKLHATKNGLKSHPSPAYQEMYYQLRNFKGYNEEMGRALYQLAGIPVEDRDLKRLPRPYSEAIAIEWVDPHTREKLVRMDFIHTFGTETLIYALDTIVFPFRDVPGYYMHQAFPFETAEIALFDDNAPLRDKVYAFATSAHLFCIDRENVPHDTFLALMPSR